MGQETEEQFIEWDHERYSSQIERFDEQHQHLFGLLNDLHRAMEQGRSEEKVGDILRELEAYTEYHFGDEEEFMQDCGFAMDCADCFFNHREMHEEFAQKVSELREKHENGEYISMEMLLFARDWLDSHIAGLSQDQNYAEYYVEEVPEEYEYEPGKLKKGRQSREDPHPDSSESEDTDGNQASTTTPTVTLGSDVQTGPSLDVPDGTMDEWVERLATDETRPGAHTESGDTLVTHSREELLERARSFAGELFDRGLEPGDRVGIHLPAGYDWTALDLACYMSGLVSVPVSQLYGPHRAAHVVEDADVSILITDEEPADQVQAAVGSVITIDALSHDGTPDLPDVTVEPDDVATIVYRIGTTEHPNGCAITHRNLRAAMAMVTETLSLEPGYTGTCYLPLAHMYQRVLTYALLDAGGSVAYLDPDRFLEQLRAAEPDVLVGVPEMYRQLYDEIQSRTDEVSGLKQALSDGVAEAIGESKDRGESISTHLSVKHTVAERTVFAPLRADLGLDTVEYALTGTEAIDPELLKFFRGFGVPVTEIYGATEISGLATINLAGTHPAETVGTPFPGVELALADDDEVLVRGPNVIEGYWNDATSWRNKLVEGWYHTGDLGSFGEHEALQIRGPK